MYVSYTNSTDNFIPDDADSFYIEAMSRFLDSAYPIKTDHQNRIIILGVENYDFH